MCACLNHMRACLTLARPRLGAAGAQVTVGDLTVTNEGWTLEPADSADDEFVRMRGYQVIPLCLAGGVTRPAQLV